MSRCAALLYERIPVTNVTTLAEPLQVLADAIEAKDSGKIVKSYGDLTDKCNGCHQFMDAASSSCVCRKLRLLLINGLLRRAGSDDRNMFIADGFIRINPFQEGRRHDPKTAVG